MPQVEWTECLSTIRRVLQADPTQAPRALEALSNSTPLDWGYQVRVLLVDDHKANVRLLELPFVFRPVTL